MTVITRPDRPTHEAEGVQFTTLATPSRGTSETSIWQVELAPGTPGFPHQVTREELFHVLHGRLTVTIEGERHEATPGDTVAVPPDTTFELTNESGEPMRALVCFPVGGHARTGEGTFTPPWAE
jgi:quercetin dioxygenase-like cupin family protein